MKNKLNHPFVYTNKDFILNFYQKLLGKDSKSTLKEWSKAMEASIKNIDWINSIVDSKQKIDEINKFKGDMFEVFAELFFTLTPTNEKFGVRDVDFATCQVNDFGVDAKGINVNGSGVAIQVKYRKNVTNEISYGALSKTHTSALVHYEPRLIDINQSHNLYLFTNCLGANMIAKNAFNPKKILVEINGKAIKNVVNNNENFWLTALTLIEKSIS